MNRHTIKMPDIGEGIAEVEIVEWHVKAGDTVVEDQVLADVMTDKASVEIPSPIAGTVVSLGGEIGDILAVGSGLITLEPHAAKSDEGIERTALETQDTAEALADAAQSAQAPPTVPAAAGTPTTSTPSVPPTAPPASAPSTAATAPKPAERPGVTSHDHSGSIENDGEQPTGSNDDQRNASSSVVLASPSVRQRARHLDIDLRELMRAQGDTPVSHRDLDDFLLSRYASGSAYTTAVEGDASADQHGDTRIKVVGLRRQIAVKMQESKREIPHFSYVEEVDVTDLEKLRTALNEQNADHEHLTMLPFLIRAVVLAVRRFPRINAHYDSDSAVITQFGAVHVGIATQSENGLLVPVLRHAESLDIWHCAAEIKRLTALARRGKAQRNDLSGSTLTISSLGALGGIAATPIINRPEVAIVGVNRIVEKPVFDKGQLVARKTMNLSSSFDHRIVDGMHAAQFIHEVKRVLEAPALLFV